MHLKAFSCFRDIQYFMSILASTGPKLWNFICLKGDLGSLFLCSPDCLNLMARSSTPPAGITVRGYWAFLGAHWAVEDDFAGFISITKLLQTAPSRSANHEVRTGGYFVSYFRAKVWKDFDHWLFSYFRHYSENPRLISACCWRR